MSALGSAVVTTPALYHERQFAQEAAKLLPGEYYVTAQDLVLVTVLGSCIAACVRDTRSGIGGMNHFMLPDAGGDRDNPVSESARYGAYAMEVLINELLKLGARRGSLEAKVFGGGRVMAELKQANIGERNAAFVLDFLRTEGIAVAAKDLLGLHPRKVYFFPRSGRVVVRKLRSAHDESVVRREQDYRSRLSATRVEGDVELFG